MQSENARTLLLKNHFNGIFSVAGGAWNAISCLGQT